MIKIIDCGSQLTQNIARRVRELGVYSEIIPFNQSSYIFQEGLEGIIVSGGQFSVYDENSPDFSRSVFDLNVPILGICYGHQLIAHMLGGEVSPTNSREYGKTKVKILKQDPLFSGIHETDFGVWMSHGDIVKQIPPEFEVTAISENNYVAAMHGKNKIYSVQFHPEVDHTENGRVILNNFLDICKAQRTWSPEKDYERIIEETKEKIRGKKGIGGISGGVDSLTMLILMNNIIGANYHPIFVNNGLLRLNEETKVQKSLESFGLDIIYIDASKRFLAELERIMDNDEKRRIIGFKFAEVFREVASQIKSVSFLAQGTLYPDVIESVPVYGSSSKIKRHHNVGGLPKDIGLEVVEPFRRLFKDEVRKIAEHKLGMPKEIVWRHPFPGPGLAVRIVGEAVTPQNLRILREADAIFIEELKARDLYYKISQAFAGILGKSIGVMGDAGTYQYMIGLRAVVTKDFMTADWFRFDDRDLEAISNRIINEVKGVNRVFYDTSQKPPSTIEWE